jgi:hypothetical protein
MVGVNFNKLPISVGILSWHSKKTLKNTLDSYVENGLFTFVSDVKIFFQETSDEDRLIAKDYDIQYIESKNNIGIGKAFVELAKNAEHENILLLEHDWVLTENQNITKVRLEESVKMLESGYDSVRLRNRRNPGHPVFSYNAYKGKELDHFCPVIQLNSPHLMDCVHWIDHPNQQFPEQIQTDNYHYVTTSRWSNWTNNPCLFKKDFYIKAVTPFFNTNDLLLENSISHWWARQDFKIAWGEGLFTHRDIDKYERV